MHAQRVVKQSAQKTCDRFHNATERLLASIQNESLFRGPITAAIDITTVPITGTLTGYLW